jgi:hypothetical protein
VKKEILDKIVALLEVLPDNYVLLRRVLLFSISELKLKEVDGKMFLEKEKVKCMEGLLKSAKHILHTESPEGIKANKVFDISHRNSCKSCSFSVKESVNYGYKLHDVYRPDETSRCDRCIERMDRLTDFADKIYDKLDLRAEKIVNDNVEIFKCKLAVNKIRRKLNKLNTKKENYETC